MVVAVSGAAGQGSAQVPARLSEATPAYSDDVLPCVNGWTLDGDGCEPAAQAAGLV